MLSETENKIIALLKTDSRYSADKIATLLGLSGEEVKSTVEKLEKRGIIVKYTAVLDGDKLGDELTDALIEVRVTPQARSGYNAIADKICCFPEVKSVFLMSGTYDLAVTVESRSMKEVALFISEKLSPIEGVTGTATHFIMKKYKDNGIVFDGSNQSERLPISE